MHGQITNFIKTTAKGQNYIISRFRYITFIYNNLATHLSSNSLSNFSWPADSEAPLSEDELI